MFPCHTGHYQTVMQCFIVVIGCNTVKGVSFNSWPAREHKHLIRFFFYLCETWPVTHPNANDEQNVLKKKRVFKTAAALRTFSHLVVLLTGFSMQLTKRSLEE